MFEKMFKRSRYVQRHLKAPLLEERIEYLRYWTDRGSATSTLTSIAQYLLRIVEFLPVASGRIITLRELEDAATAWGKYQCNHPQKRVPFSKCGKERFEWYATDWLKRLHLLEPLSEESIPLFNKIFERRAALKRHTGAPLLKERLMYLQSWADAGATHNLLRRIAQYLLIIMEHLDFYEVRKVSPDEIEEAANRWGHQQVHGYLKQGTYSKSARARFSSDALGWFKLLGCLKIIERLPLPFEKELQQYVDYMRHEQGLAETTIKSRIHLLQDFLKEVWHSCTSLLDLTPLVIDEILIKKHDTGGYSRRTVQSYGTVIRSFVRHQDALGQCRSGLAATIKAPRVYRYESLPSSPSWDDVQTVLKDTEGDHPTDIRDRAILMLLSIYGLRCSEVVKLRLEDIDWKGELLHLKRAKTSRPQTFPLIQTVGDAILRYIQEVRQNQSTVREVFLCRRAPYRRLTNSGVYRIVSMRLKPLGSSLRHYGPHALRHACATHLINEGVSLKEISDQLGHQGLETTRIYAKVDLTSLRQIAEFDIGDLL
jgi:integrase/recombinase XerD